MSQVWQVHTKSTSAEHVYTTEWGDTNRNQAATHQLPKPELSSPFSRIDMATETEEALASLNMNPVWKFNLWAESCFCNFPINNPKTSVSRAINQTLQKETEMKYKLKKYTLYIMESHRSKAFQQHQKMWFITFLWVYYSHLSYVS